MKVSLHPAQAAAKPRLSDGAGLLDGFQSGFFAMNAKLFEERTVFKVGPPTQSERVGRAPDFGMTADSGVGCFIQLPPDDFSRRASAGRGRRRTRFCR